MQVLNDGSIVYDSFEEISEAWPIGQETIRYEQQYTVNPADPSNPISVEYKVITKCWGYTYNGKYIWATSQSQAVGNANGLSQSQCTGCASGYKAQGSTCVVDCGSHASYTDAGCVCDVGYYKSGGSCVKGAGYCERR